AFGIVVSADGDASINTSGAITVTSGGTGYGAMALSFAGDAVAVNSGDVNVEASTATSKYYGSYGLLAFRRNGYAAVGNRRAGARGRRPGPAGRDGVQQRLAVRERQVRRLRGVCAVVRRRCAGAQRRRRRDRFLFLPGQRLRRARHQLPRRRRRAERRHHRG